MLSNTFQQSPFLLDTFVNVEYGVIGRTVSTKSDPNTSRKFQFWIAKRDPSSSLEIGNIVAAYADSQEDITFGSIVEMRSYSDIDSFIADFLSHDFGNAEVEVPTDVSEVIVVTCNVMRNLSNQTKPVERSRVYFPSRLGVQFAYGIVNDRGETIYSGAPIPMGVFENGDGTIVPISVDENFLVGPEGAHLNVSGISGLAAKTSAIQFCLKSLLSHSQRNVAVVMFNVKSRDLLYVDQPNTRLDGENPNGDEWSINTYNILSIPPTPFENARFFAPSNPTNPDAANTLRTLPTERFEWDLGMIYRDIPTLFNPFDWDDRVEGVWFVIQDRIEQGNILSYAQMLTWTQQQITQANAARPPQTYILGSHVLTWNKVLGHLRRFPRAFPGLIKTAGQGSNVPWNELQNGSVFVIDIQVLGDRGQRLVFGRAMRAISELLEGGESNLDAVVVFVDELNKFAPSGNIRTPLKDRLIDITARGRSLGLILFGAEQFASSVDKEIVENSSTYLFGRTETTELRSPNYVAFTDEVQAKLTMLPQGRLLIKSAKFSQPIFLRFPYPPCLPGDQYVERA